MNAKLEWKPNEHGFEDSTMYCTVRFRTESEENHKIDLHYHDHIEIIYSVSKTAIVGISNQQYRLCEGDIAIVNSSHVHFAFPEEDGSKYFVIKFKPEALQLQGVGLSEIRYLLSLWQNEIDTDPIVPAKLLKDSGMDMYIRDIMDECSKQSRGYQAIIYSDIMRLFIWMVRSRCSRECKTSAISKDLQTALGLITQEIRAHLCDYTAADAARDCNFSYSYFCSNFKKAYGMSFSAYLETVRLQEAERLLLTTKRDITDISSAVGFSTTSYFIERFKSLYGLTPRTFRMQLGTATKQ